MDRTKNVKRANAWAAACLSLMWGGCAVDAEEETVGDEFGELSASSATDGEFLFDHETFGGNGRTCKTCHGDGSGTLSAEDAAQRLAANPNDPLFLHDGTDDGTAGTTRITTHATIRVGIPLPAGVSLVQDPGASSVIVLRGILSTRNSPALDPVIMWDGREQSLESQAKGAILGHAQATVAPTAEQLAAIAEFERTDPRFFSSDALADFAQGGPAPQLPAATTAAEARGRRFLLPGGRCATCHGGPMLNEKIGGGRFESVRRAELRRSPNGTLRAKEASKLALRNRELALCPRFAGLSKRSRRNDGRSPSFYKNRY